MDKQGLTIRLTSDQKRALVAAASIQHLSLSEFVRQSALNQATEACGIVGSVLSVDDWRAFTAALSAPRRDPPRLRARLRQTERVQPWRPSKLRRRASTRA